MTSFYAKRIIHKFDKTELDIDSYGNFSNKSIFNNIFHFLFQNVQFPMLPV